MEIKYVILYRPLKILSSGADKFGSPCLEKSFSSKEGNKKVRYETDN